MHAQLEVKWENRTEVLSLSTGRYAIRSGEFGSLLLVPISLTEAKSEPLSIEFDSSTQLLGWCTSEMKKQEAIASGESFFNQKVQYTFSLKLDSPMIAGSACESIQLEKGRSHVFGRSASQPSPDGTESLEIFIALDSQERSISKRHTQVFQADSGAWLIKDISSTETLLNGQAFSEEKLIFGDRFKIQSYVFEFRGTQIIRVDHLDSGRVEATDLVVVVKDRRTGKPMRILNKVDLQIETGQFIGILGGSGQGKSTLLNALCGIRPADEGSVKIGGVVNTLLNKIRPGSIGFVPQDDIVHPELIVRDAFHFSAKLRLRLDKAQRETLVEKTIELLGLSDHASKRIAYLSGGQRKRVSIGVELLSKPTVLFLDEPSSGLDPATESALMELLQSLTKTNLTVVCTTHVLQKAYLFRRLLFVHDGRVIFDGSSARAREFFNGQKAIDSSSAGSNRSEFGPSKSPIERIYSEVLFGPKSAQQWQDEFQAWSTRPSIGKTIAVEQSPTQSSKREKRVSALTRYRTLLVRQWKIISADWLNFAFLFCQVILIGFLIAIVPDEFGLRFFLGLIATMWFGCSNGAQQIVAELPILRREQVCGQGRNVYLCSKFTFQGVVSSLQGLVLFSIIVVGGHLAHPVDFDEPTFRTVYEEGLKKDGNASVSRISAEDEKELDAFVPVTDDEDPKLAVSPPKKADVQQVAAAAPGKFPLPTGVAIWMAKLFAMEDCLLDSFSRPMTDLQGNVVNDPDGDPLKYDSIPGWQIVGVNLGLKLFAYLGAAWVGVAMGLAVSATVRTPTQAVMWVPLLLIPQILFGGYVVTLPKMSASVRSVSTALPSNGCQRIIDVSNLYGRATPLMTNLTKHPIFLTLDGKEEEIKWKTANQEHSEKFKRESYVNTSWQNLAVIPAKVGEHQKETELAGVNNMGSQIVKERDTTSVRNDVRYAKGTPYLFLFPAMVSTWILLAWLLVCYMIALVGIHKKTIG